MHFNEECLITLIFLKQKYNTQEEKMRNALKDMSTDLQYKTAFYLLYFLSRGFLSYSCLKENALLFGKEAVISHSIKDGRVLRHNEIRWKKQRKKFVPLL